MSDIIMLRRRFLAGLVGLIAAPMVMRAAALMPVKAFEALPFGAVRCANGAILEAIYRDGLIIGVNVLNAGSGYLHTSVITLARPGAGIEAAIVWVEDGNRFAVDSHVRQS